MNVWVFVQCLAGDEGARKTSAEVKHIVEIMSTMERYLCLDCNWSRKYECYDLGAVWDCYIAKIDIENENDLLVRPMIGLTVKESAE